MKGITRVWLATALLGACGGNYSNEDLDFQAALPEHDDLVAKLPAQALTTADSAEYYRTTRDVVKIFNTVLDGFLGLIDGVRAYPPTQRQPSTRIWGPFLADKFPDWQIRMVMDRKPDAAVAGFGYHFDYQLQVRRARLPDAPWLSLLTGSFAPSGGARKGSGQMIFDTVAARAAGYPLTEFGDLQRLDVTYQTVSFPVTVDMVIANRPGADSPGATYQYRERADGSGEMVFAWRTKEARSLQVRSRWLGSGAGRSDVRVTEGLGLGLGGVDCWGIDTHATFVRRDWDAAANSGSEATCAYAAP